MAVGAVLSAPAECTRRAHARRGASVLRLGGGVGALVVMWLRVGEAPADGA